MKKRTLVLAVLVALTFCFLSAGFVPAAHAATRSTKLSASVVPSGSIRPFINETPCTSGAFVRLHSSRYGDLCFANDGYIGLGPSDFYYVTLLHSGNNNGWIRYYDSSGGHYYYFTAYANDVSFNNVEVTQVDITGQG